MSSNSDRNTLLRQKDLIARLGIPKTTLADWINAFSPYVPIVRQGRTRYYTEDSIIVLARVRDLRAGGYDKSQISEKLAYEFPIDVDEVERKAELYRDPDEGRDAVYLALQTVGEMAKKMDELVEDNASLRKELETKLGNQDEKIAKQDEYINNSLEERDKKLNETMTDLIDRNKKRSLIDRILGR